MHFYCEKCIAWLKWGPYRTRGPRNKKLHKTKKVLGFYFCGGLFYAKLPKSSLLPHTGEGYFVLYWNFYFPPYSVLFRIVVVVKWSACSPSTPKIRVCIPLKPTVFSVILCLKRTKINKKEAGVGPPFKKKYLYGQLANLGVQVNKHFSVIGVDKRIGLKLLQISKCLC